MKRQSGEMTLEEQLEFSELTGNDENSRLFVEAMSEIFSSSLIYPDHQIKPGSVNKALEKIRARMRESDAPPAGIKYRRLRPYLAVAAAVVVLLACAFFYRMQVSGRSAHADNVVATRKGSKTNLVLPDGTKVWVNADSRLSYGKNFGNQLREVYLEGEAYFDVAEDKRKPFIVHTNNIDVKVLGTAFNVRAYGNEVNTQTTLLRGSVEVMLKKDNNRKVLLVPNEKIIVRNNQGRTDNRELPLRPVADVELLKLTTGKRDSLSVETQWTQNRLVFEQETLADIIPVLERWYNITIELKKVKDSDILYRGAFENDSLKDVLESLKMIGNFSYIIQKDKVVIY
jgi:ferric-dicitrate binding protein FerR (iron transport regulator)